MLDKFEGESIYIWRGDYLGVGLSVCPSVCLPVCRQNHVLYMNFYEFQNLGVCNFFQIARFITAPTTADIQSLFSLKKYLEKGSFQNNQQENRKLILNQRRQYNWNVPGVDPVTKLLMGGARFSYPVNIFSVPTQ